MAAAVARLAVAFRFQDSQLLNAFNTPREELNADSKAFRIMRVRACFFRILIPSQPSDSRQVKASDMPGITHRILRIRPGI
jgi:hypothetical protein